MRTLLIIPIVSLLFSCNSAPIKKQAEKVLPHADTLQHVSSDTTNQLEETLKTVPPNIQPVFGYRFVISGDFDGDGKQERLIEHFFSGIDHKETNKFYDSLPEYDQLVALTMKKEPYCFITSDNNSIDSFHIAADGQLLGLSYLKNEGDLDGDGADEISYVINWADWSNLNTWHIATYKNKKWVELYSFPIWDWQLPDLPETFSEYGLFGLENKFIDTKNDTADKRMEKELLNFPGLVKKIGTDKIRVIYRNDDAEEDSMIVNLRRKSRNNKVNSQ
ncbi:hypothetical protein [Ferruginibacter sp.]